MSERDAFNQDIEIKGMNFKVFFCSLSVEFIHKKNVEAALGSFLNSSSTFFVCVCKVLKNFFIVTDFELFMMMPLLNHWSWTSRRMRIKISCMCKFFHLFQLFKCKLVIFFFNKRNSLNLSKQTREIINVSMKIFFVVQFVSMSCIKIHFKLFHDIVRKFLPTLTK